MAVLDTVRVFNKHLLNPAMLLVAGRKHWYAGVIEHTGRQSGNNYATPVVAERVSDGVIIPLPYGTHTDWLENVLASDGCSLTLNGQDYTFTGPEIIVASLAERLVPPANAAVWRRVGIKNYLSMKTASPVAAAAETLLAAR